MRKRNGIKGIWTVLSPQQREGEEEVVVINDNNSLLNKEEYPLLNEEALCL